MTKYGVREIQQYISEALRQLKDGDRPIITSNGQSVAAIITMEDLGRLNSMTNIQFALLLQEYARQIDREVRQLHEVISEEEFKANGGLFAIRATNERGRDEYVALDGLCDLAAAIRKSAETLVKSEDTP